MARDPGVIRRELARAHALAERSAAVSPAVVKTAMEIAAARAADALDRLDLIQALLQRQAGPQQRAIGDADGTDLRPDPLQAATGAELAAAVQRYREWAGSPSYRLMSQRLGGSPAAATICTALTSGRPLKLGTLVKIVAACGGDDEDQRRFASAWRQIHGAAPAPAQPEPPAQDGEDTGDGQGTGDAVGALLHLTGLIHARAAG